MVAQIGAGPSSSPGRNAERSEATLMMEQRFTFDRIAELYDRHRPSYPPTLIDDIALLSRLPRDGRILEIGSGTGKATVLLASLGRSILGLEPGVSLAAIARENLRDYAKTEIVCETFEDWRIDPDLFDLVVSAQAIHWVRPELRFNKTADALLTGGSFAILGNSNVYDQCSLRSELDSIYERDAPTLLGPPPTAWYSESGPLRRMFAESRLFEPVVHRQFDWCKTYTTEEYLGLLQTHSNHQMLPPAQLDQLLASIARLIMSSGDRIELSYETHLYLAKRTPREST
jgi:SAM-dependent methyltransferase